VRQITFFLAIHQIVDAKEIEQFYNVGHYLYIMDVGHYLYIMDVGHYLYIMDGEADYGPFQKSIRNKKLLK